MAANERGVLLHRLADAAEKRKPILAQIEALDAGKVLGQAEGDVQNFVDTLRYYTDLALHVQRRSPLAVARHEAWITRQPWGPCGFIFPWNFPILLIGWNISPALAAGNTVVIKPAEDTPLSAIYVARLAREVGIPDGVINVVPGYGPVAGAALAAHPGLKRMSFTGSPEVGRSIAGGLWAEPGARQAGTGRQGGGRGVRRCRRWNGRWRSSSRRSPSTPARSAAMPRGGSSTARSTTGSSRPVSERLRQVKIGHQMDASTEMGPVVNEKQRRRVLGYLERGRNEGAEVVLEGGEAKVPGHDGFYVKPALLAGSLDNVAAREEIFGPVAYLAAFEDEEEAVRMANRTDYGLANSVWTSDLTRACRVAEAMLAGNSWINAHNLFPHGVPYAGVNKSGLGGGVLSVETLFDYWRNLSVVRPL